MRVSVGRKSCMLLMALLFVGMAAGGALAAEGQVVSANGITSYAQPANAGVSDIDLRNAKPMPLPQAHTAPSSVYQGAFAPNLGTPAVSLGSPGTGEMNPVTLPIETGEDVPGHAGESGHGEYGTQNVPYTTSRVDVGASNTISIQYPFRAGVQPNSWLLFTIAGKF